MSRESWDLAMSNNYEPNSAEARYTFMMGWTPPAELLSAWEGNPDFLTSAKIRAQAQNAQELSVLSPSSNAS